MKNTCLNCKWEPEWSDFKTWGGRVGKCKHPLVQPGMKYPACVVAGCPKFFNITTEPGGGIYYNCRTWEPKDENMLQISHGDVT